MQDYLARSPCSSLGIGIPDDESEEEEEYDEDVGFRREERRRDARKNLGVGEDDDSEVGCDSLYYWDDGAGGNENYLGNDVWLVEDSSPSMA